MRISPITIDSDNRTAVPTVLVIGDHSTTEMQPLFAWLQSLVTKSTRIVHVREIANISDAFATEDFPDLILVFQNWPDEYSQSDVNELFRFAPLARLIVCYGPWCESDGRNRSVWPISVRVPVWSSQARIEREWQLIQSSGDQRPLPLSASREEVFAADHLAVRIWTIPQHVVIDSPDPALQQFLAELLIATGHKIDDDRPTILLFDSDPWGPMRVDALKRLRMRYPNAEIYGLSNAISAAQTLELNQLGVDKQIHKFGLRLQY